MVARTWAGGAVGNWNLAANWLPAVVPTGVDTATIDLAGGAIVTGDVAIACAAIYIGAAQAANVLLAQYGVDVPIVEVGPTAGSYIEFDGDTIGSIDVELDEFDVRIAGGCKFKGVVDFHGPSYGAPMDIQAAVPARGADWRTFDATADVEWYWVQDTLSTEFVIASGGRVLAFRGCQFEALDPWEVHVAGVRYAFSGSWKDPQYGSGGVYSVKDRLGNRSEVKEQGRRPKFIAWSGVIYDATYWRFKDELQQWNNDGTIVTVTTRDGIVTGKITDFGWRPTGPHKGSFYYQIEVTEAD